MKNQNPTAEAFQWVSKITTVSLEMTLPALIGFWIDEKFGTQFVKLIGLGFGFTLGMYHLLQMTIKK